MLDSKYKFTCIERFLKYVQIDTQSNPDSKTYPSTSNRRIVKFFVKELKEMGIKMLSLISSAMFMQRWNQQRKRFRSFVSFHMIFRPNKRSNVKPVIHKNYEGGDIILPGDETQILNPGKYHELKGQVGNDIITSDGTTLLGADNKAGVAEIMDAVNYLNSHPKIKHENTILFTDEEIGRGR
jgi:tripeptide aminopeptidase